MNTKQRIEAELAALKVKLHNSSVGEDQPDLILDAFCYYDNIMLWTINVAVDNQSWIDPSNTNKILLALQSKYGIQAVAWTVVPHN